MSDLKDTKLETIDLLPSEITTDPKYDVRPFERHATGEYLQRSMEEIELLARDIENNGQLDPVYITGTHVLVCGHRRRKAVILINERRTVRGQPLLKLRCSVDRTGTDLVIKAVSSNLQRKSISPIDLAYFIHNFRKERDLLGYGGLDRTARILSIPREVISKGMRLMQSSKEIQNRLHEGIITTETALILIKASIPADQLLSIFVRSKEIQEENETTEIVEQVEAKRKTHTNGTAELARVSTNKRISRPAVVQSLREYHTTKSPPNRKAIPLTYSLFLKGLTTADTSAQCAQARKLIRYLVKEYAAGKSTQAELERQFHLAFEGDIPMSAHAASLQAAACY